MVERPRVVNALTWTGWAVLAGYLGVLLGQLDQALDSAPGWSDRLHILSFAAGPPGATLVVIAALCALAANAVRAGYGSADLHPGRTARLGIAAMVAAAISLMLVLVGVATLASTDYGSELGRATSLIGGGVMAAAAFMVGSITTSMSPPTPSPGPSNGPHHARPLSPFAQPPSSPPR